VSLVRMAHICLSCNKENASLLSITPFPECLSEKFKFSVKVSN